MVKHLFAVGAGLAMLGATAAGAMAADLKDYPSQFVKDGVFNGYIVVGEKANAVDNLAATDIASAMKYLKKTETTTTTVSGDAWKVGTGSKALELTDNAVAANLVNETFSEIVSYISSDELDALKSGVYTAGSKEFSFNQYFYFDTPQSTKSSVVQYMTDDDSVTADYLYFANGFPMVRYKLEFTSPAESAVASDLAGTASTSGQYLSDFDNTKINLLGKEYTVVLATRPASGRTNSAKLTLMGGATSDTILEGEEKTYTLSGKEYKVKLSYVDDDEAKFIVNGESTDKMQAGATKKLSDGKEIGVSEILYQSYAGGVHSATFFLGASKLVLQDDDITVGTSGYEVESGTETIDGAHVIITGTDNNVTFRINTIEINSTADDNFFVGEGKKLSDAIVTAGSEKEVLFTNNWDVEYKGLAKDKTHDIQLSTSSDRKYNLEWYDGDNNKVAMPLAYAVSASQLAVGESNTEKRVYWNDNVNLSKNDYFVLTGGSINGAKGQAKSYLIQYKGADNTGKSSPKIKFKNVGSSETLEYSVASNSGDATQVATIKIGGYSCRIYNQSSAASDDFSIQADVDCGDEATESGESVQIKDYYGAKIYITAMNNSDGGLTEVFTASDSGINSINLTIATISTDDYDNKAPNVVTLNVSGTSGPEVRASLGAVYSLITPEGVTDTTYGYTTMGGKLTFTSPSGSPNVFTYAYPEKQALPQVYFTSGAVTETTADGTWTAVEVVDATKLDSEIADVKAQNLIVIGGPCVNTAAAALLGNPATCTEGFAPGKARIKLFEPATGKFALLVAGYSGADTRLAGKVIAHRWKELSGTEVEVEGTTYSDAKIGAPTPVVAETPVVETPVTQ